MKGIFVERPRYTEFIKKALIIIIGVALVVVFYSVSVYNGLVGKREAIDNQWAQVETQYQRGLDLIPNLVESVKGVMKQEQVIFTALAGNVLIDRGYQVLPEYPVIGYRIDLVV